MNRGSRNLPHSAVESKALQSFIISLSGGQDYEGGSGNSAALSRFSSFEKAYPGSVSLASCDAVIC